LESRPFFVEPPPFVFDMIQPFAMLVILMTLKR